MQNDTQPVVPCPHRSGHASCEHRTTFDRTAVIALLVDDAYAATFQTMGQYRSALIKAIAAADTWREDRIAGIARDAIENHVIAHTIPSIRAASKRRAAK